MEWNEAGRRMTNNLTFVRQETTVGTEVVTIKLKRDIV